MNTGKTYSSELNDNTDFDNAVNISPVGGTSAYAVDFSYKPGDAPKRRESNLKNAAVCNVFAIIGLLLSFFYGAGIIFSAVAFILSMTKLIKHKNREYKASAVLGAAGFIAALIYIAVLIAV